MNRSQKIATAASALAVAGLVALAAPAVASVASTVGGWAVFNQPAAAPTAATATSTPEPEADAEAADLPGGYVQLGNGTSIPAGGPGECESSAYIWIGSMTDEPIHPEMLGADLVDMGSREFAVGDVKLDDQGRPATYTVAPGDALFAIGDRFCIYNGLSLASLNGYRGYEAIQPGDVLTLNADLVTDWVDPYADQ